MLIYTQSLLTISNQRSVKNGKQYILQIKKAMEVLKRMVTSTSIFSIHETILPFDFLAQGNP